MKQKKYASNIIYIISLVTPVVLTAAFFLLYVIAFLSAGRRNSFAVPQLLMAVISLVIYFCLFMMIPLVTYSILYLIQIYRMWNVINDGKSRMTPGQAIGFLFVPFYNLYWIFQVWDGFPTDYNAFIDRYRLQQKVPYLKSGLYDLFPFLIILSGFIITIPILLIYFAFLLNRTNVAIDNLKMAVAEVRNQLPSQPVQNHVLQPQISFSSQAAL